MKVLLVAAATSTTGGGERHIADLLRRLPDAGAEVELVCPEGGDLSVLAFDLGVGVYHAEIAAGMSPAALAAVRDAIAESAPDIVHAHGSRAALFARLADPRAAKRVVYTVHGIHIDKAGSFARRATLLNVERMLRPRTARFITVCDSDIRKGARLRLLQEGRTSTVYNGIEMPESTPPPGAFRDELGLAADVPLALSVGRFHEQKDQATLLRAWARVVAARPDAVLALVGSGPLEGPLRELAFALDLAGSLGFVTPRPDLAPAYVDCDVFVLSSLWEGLPYVVLEAMSYGTPVVASAVDGIPEAVVDGESGWLVPPSDAVALASALQRQLELDPADRERVAAAARARVQERFGLDVMVSRLVALYAELLGR